MLSSVLSNVELRTNNEGSVKDYCGGCKQTVEFMRDLNGKQSCVCGWIIDTSQGFAIGFYPLFHPRNNLSEDNENG